MSLELVIEQLKPTLNKKQNYKLHINKIKEAIKNNLNIIVFPELSLNGYLVQDLVKEDFYTITELKEFQELSIHIDILIGVIYKSSGGRAFNTAVYFHKGEINLHYKNNLPNYGMFEENRFFYEGRGFNNFEINNKKITLAICEDVWDQQNLKQLKNLEADIIYILAASPARDFHKSLNIQKKWYDILNKISYFIPTVIFVNRVGVEDGISFWGGSKVIDTQNNIELNTFNEEQGLVTIC